jgi:multiple sugar transport system substrate-binding protein
MEGGIEMRRLVVILGVFALAVTACTAGGSSSTPATINPSTSHAPVTIEIWGAWTGRELRQFNQIFDGFTEQYPWITVKSVGGVGDQKIIAGINSGTPPDVVLSFTPDNVGQFCSSGAWQDLKPYMDQTGFDLSQIPEGALAFTSFGGSQCALPFLTDTYGLYYNNDMLKKAGISEPPKTLSELQTDAKKLTVFNSDGSIKVAGFVPWFGYYEFSPLSLSIMFNAPWYNEDGTSSAVATDPAWKDMFEWQKAFIADVYGDGDFATGASRLQRFVAGAGNEFSSAHDMYTGRIAMNLDGEWRTAFIADEKPDMNYGTAPFPVPDDQANNYGMGPMFGTIIGMPRGAEHGAEAWLLLQYMSTDTATLVYMANNVRNVPTTLASLDSPDLEVTPQFQTFLDIFKNPLSHDKPPTAIGSADQDIVSSFAENWQAGAEADLAGGLQQAAKQIDDQLAQQGP